MRFYLSVLLFAILSFMGSVEAGYVKGYYRKNGTYVAPHYRSNKGSSSYKPSSYKSKSSRSYSSSSYSGSSSGFGTLAEDDESTTSASKPSSYLGAATQTKKSNINSRIKTNSGASRDRSSEYELTIGRMKKIVAAIVMYKSQRSGALPESLQELSESSSGILMTDGWGAQFRFEIKGKGYVLSSAGPDQESGTTDDIVVRDGIAK